MDVLQNVSPTAGLEYDDSVAFAPSEEPIISATSGAKPGRITPVQMVSFETPGRISYSADYEAENNSPEPNADETPVQTPAPASPEMEATPAFKGIQLESFDASATTTDEPKALLHAVSEMAMPTEQQAAATIEPAAPTTTTVVEQSLDMARIRHVKQKRMQKNLIFGKLVAEFQTFLLRAGTMLCLAVCGAMCQPIRCNLLAAAWHRSGVCVTTERKKSVLPPYLCLCAALRCSAHAYQP